LTFFRHSLIIKKVEKYVMNLTWYIFPIIIGYILLLAWSGRGMVKNARKIHSRLDEIEKMAQEAITKDEISAASGVLRSYVLKEMPSHRAFISRAKEISSYLKGKHENTINT